MRSRKRRFTGHQFCPPPYRTTRLHCKHCGQINWQFTFADSLRLPRHARACPMRAHTCTLPLWCRRRLDRQRSKPKLPQIRQEWRRRYGGKSRSTCWLDGGDLVVPVSSPIRAAVPGATPRGRPSERLRAAVPASDSARPSRERLRADGAPFRRPVLALCAPFRRPDTVCVTPPARLPVVPGTVRVSPPAPGFYSIRFRAWHLVCHSAAPSLHCARHFAAPTLCASLRLSGCKFYLNIIYSILNLPKYI
jgi:hypothetical protein